MHIGYLYCIHSSCNTLNLSSAINHTQSALIYNTLFIKKYTGIFYYQKKYSVKKTTKRKRNYVYIKKTDCDYVAPLTSLCKMYSGGCTLHNLLLTVVTPKAR